MRKLLLAALGAVVIILGFLSFGGRSPESRSDEPTPGGVGSGMERSGEPSQEAELATVEAAAQSARSHLTGAGAESGAVGGEPSALAEALAEAVAGEVAVAGRIDVLALPEVDPDKLNGSLRLSLKAGDTGYSMDVAVAGGRFEAVLKPLGDGRFGRGQGRSSVPGSVVNGDVTLRDVALDAPLALRIVRTSDKSLGILMDPVPFGTLDVVLTMEAAPKLTLHVVEAASGRPLDDLEVRGSAALGLILSGHPAFLQTEPYARTTSSPVALHVPSSDAWRKQVFVLARAPGLAWGMVALDPSVDGEYTLELLPGGRLEVDVKGDVPDGAELTIQSLTSRPPGSGRIRAQLQSAKLFSIDDLVAGAYRVSVSQRSVLRGREPLAQAQVDVVAGTSTAVTLDLGGREVGELVPLAGTVSLPEHWDAETAVLILRRQTPSFDQRHSRETTYVRDLESVEGRERTFSFAYEEMEVGPWIAHLTAELHHRGDGWSLEFMLDSGGLTDLEVAPPASVDFTIHVRDETTGLPIPNVRVHVIHALPKGWEESSTAFRLARRTNQDGTVRYRVVPGTFRLSVGADGFARSSESERTWTLVGDEEIVLELIPTLPVSLRYIAEGEPVRGAYMHECEIETADGSDTEIFRAGYSSETTYPYRFQLAGPGLYRLVFPKIEGSELPSPLEFEVKENEPTELEVELVPSAADESQ